ncbi:MAG: hypothetical protein IKH70_00600 [Stomatobaculum sp.]|nr:hypothetical protein [Stomatobaculum sp.]
MPRKERISLLCRLSLKRRCNPVWRGSAAPFHSFSAVRSVHPQKYGRSG